jgi:hypothetical protein
MGNRDRQNKGPAGEGHLLRLTHGEARRIALPTGINRVECFTADAHLDLDSRDCHSTHNRNTSVGGTDQHRSNDTANKNVRVIRVFAQQVLWYVMSDFPLLASANSAIL